MSRPQFGLIADVFERTETRYVADRFNFFTIAYNTNLVKKEDLVDHLQAQRVQRVR